MSKKIYMIVFVLLAAAVSLPSCKKKQSEYTTRISGDSLFIHRPTLVLVPWSVVAQGTPEDAATYREAEEKARWYRAKFASEKLDVYFGRTQLVTFQDSTREFAPVFTNMKMDGYEMAIFDGQGKPHYAQSWDSEKDLVSIMDSLALPINPSPNYINSLTKEEAPKK
ncbi:MAG: hypothetical protein ACOVMR_08620 [Flavobacteriales bacterium]